MPPWLGKVGVASQYSVQCNVVYPNTVKYSAVGWKVVQCFIVRLSVVQCSEVPCSSVQFSELVFDAVVYSLVDQITAAPAFLIPGPTRLESTGYPEEH